jgi:glutamate-1-semialdehyde 2,1-aminomutase
MSRTEMSEKLFREATDVIPGGVNSPVRAFKAVGLPPRFIRSGKGCRIVDEDGNEFIDFVGSWGPLILGHAYGEVLEALSAAMKDGTSFGAPTRREVELAQAITEMVPSVEMVRLVNSGTEATMSAIRLARGFTGRDTIVKFSGCYHGHNDALLVRAGSGAATFSIPDSLGVPAGVVEKTVVFPFNDHEAVRSYIKESPGTVAAVILEPVAGNMGVVPPLPGFLQSLRDICDQDECVLIFDEVISGFRVAAGGAQQLYGIKPDMTCLGKILGGGLPLAAFGGSRRIMEHLAPSGGVYQAGTLSGNPLAVAAGLTTLRILRRDNPYPDLERKSAMLTGGIEKAFQQKRIPCTLNRIGSMFSVFFHPGPVRSYEEALLADREAFKAFFSRMLDQRVYLAPSAFEAWFVSVAHSDSDIQSSIQAVSRSL